MKIHICGTRGSTQAPGRDFVRYGGHASCVAIAEDGAPPHLLLDAGTGIRNVWGLLGHTAFEGSILLGHLHWDHVHGLPFFRGGDHPGSRVDLYIPEQSDDLTEVLERGFSPPHFPVRPTELRGRWSVMGLGEGTRCLEGFEVLAREIPHIGGRTFGFRITSGTGTVAYLSDHHPSGLGPGPDGFGPYHEAPLALTEGVDLLIHDAQYLQHEWPDRHNFGHSTVGYAVGLAETAGARRLLLFHHDPARTDTEVDEPPAAARLTAAVEVEAAFDGQIIDV